MTQEERNLAYYNRTYKEVEGILYKRCPKCEEYLIEKDNYYFQNGKAGTNCKKCESKKNYEYQQSHIEKRDKYQRTSMSKPQNQINARRTNVRQRAKGNSLRWQQNNPEKLTQYRLDREHKKHMISKTEWKSCLDYFDNQCAYCGLLVKDYFVVYGGVTKQGTLNKEHVNHEGANDLSNSIPACKICNSEKHTQKFNEWYNESNIKFNQERMDRIEKWLSEDYKLYIEEKIVLPYIITKIRNDGGIIISYELWSKDNNGEPLTCLGNGKKKTDLKIYIDKFINMSILTT